jgi:hypothetical protein
VTSDRVIINSGLFRPTTQSRSLRTLSDVTMRERSDGSGTIAFIPDVRRGYDILRDAQRATAGRKG